MRGEHWSHGRFCGSGAGSSRKEHANASHTRALTHSGGALLLLLPLCCVNTPFVAFPVDSCHTCYRPVTVRRAVKLKFEMQM